MEAEFNINVLGEFITPSPAEYAPPSKFGDVPKVNIRPRIPIHEDKTDPLLVNLKTTIGTGPKVACTPRRPLPEPYVTPGPKYMTPDFAKDAKKVGFPRARPQTARSRSPGPAKYVQERITGADSPYLHVRTGPRKLWDETYSPGPAAYKPRYDRTRAASPQYTIKHKYKDRAKDKTGEYIAQRSTLSGPKFTMAKSGRCKIMH